MVNPDELSGFAAVFLKHIIPALGALVALLVFLAPMVRVLRGRKTGVLGDINPVPYPCQVGNCIAWIAYGSLIVDYYVVWANVPGLLLGIFYCLSSYGLAYKEEFEERLQARTISAKSVDRIMTSAPQTEMNGSEAAKAADQSSGVLVSVPTAKMAEDKMASKPPRTGMQLRTRRVEFAIAFVIIVDFIAIWVTCFYLDKEAAKTTLGAVANFMVAILYISPLITMFSVIKTKSAASIDPRWTAGQLVNCILWSIYGIVMNDPWIYAVNVFGVGTGLIQYALLAVYGEFSCCPGRRRKSQHPVASPSDVESADSAPTPTARGSSDNVTDKNATQGPPSSKALDPSLAPGTGAPEADHVVDLDTDSHSADGPQSV